MATYRPCLGPQPGHPCPDRALVTPPASRCPGCGNERRRARRHPGYDDPGYRRARKQKVGRPCEICLGRTALTVHHRDGNPANNTPGNLQGACPECAHKADVAMRVERRRRRQR